MRRPLAIVWSRSVETGANGSAARLHRDRAARFSRRRVITVEGDRGEDEASTAVVIGAGNRGRLVYAHWAHAHPTALRVVAVAEPDDVSRSAVATITASRRNGCSATGPSVCRARVSPTSRSSPPPIRWHVEPALAAIARGYDVLLEKRSRRRRPSACAWSKRPRRRVPAPDRPRAPLHALLREDPRDRAQRACWRARPRRPEEHVAQWHMTHSFVRGDFATAASLRRSFWPSRATISICSPGWWIARRCAWRRSGRSRTTGRSERRPARRCAVSDGCPVQASCPHDAVRLLHGPEDAIARVWPWCDVSPDPSRAARRRALETGSLRALRGSTATTTCSTTRSWRSSSRVASPPASDCTTRRERAAHDPLDRHARELRGLPRRRHHRSVACRRAGRRSQRARGLGVRPLRRRPGPDGALQRVAAERQPRGARVGRAALESHLIGFAAERARETGQVVAMQRFRAGAYAEAGLAPR